MGIVFLARSPKQEIMAVCTVETGWFLGRQLFSGMLLRPSHGKSQKSYHKTVLFSMENELEKQRKNR